MAFNIVDPTHYLAAASELLETGPLTLIDGEFVEGVSDNDLDEFYEWFRHGEKDGTAKVTVAVPPIEPNSPSSPSELSSLPPRVQAPPVARSITPTKKPKSRHQVAGGIYRVKRSIIKELPVRHPASGLKVRTAERRQSTTRQRVRSVQSRAGDRRRRLRKKVEREEKVKLWLKLERALQSILEPLVHLVECGLWPHPRLSPQQLMHMYNKSLCAAHMGGSYATSGMKTEINRSLKMVNTLQGNPCK
ncbi:hypothetical protein Poli38472_002764 [Pythium oligandrum]|uniref:Uncharacterized protein n=1 Tax=Pythium oligandrum TaxID=41045 RepID=A0A8K1FMM9_PYTOL|nr:hypothetical protein Poli38472_002764 [Pythium oligandrum]|eukprot:TMW63823.1 hypothetical protein Poli38472_002764 [Pythium oligandrum]